MPERRPDSGRTEDNVRDDREETREKDDRSKHQKDASREAVEEEEKTGGAKRNVRDE